MPKWWLFHRFFILSTILGGSACRAAAFRQCFSFCAAVCRPFRLRSAELSVGEFLYRTSAAVMIGNIIGGSTVVARRVLVCVFAREGNGVALQQGPASLNRPGIGYTMSIESQRAETSRQRPGLAWLRYLPPARWLAEYRLGWLTGDVVAGVTLAAYAIPVSLAYAELAGLAAAGRHLRLPARRARLCVARLVAPTGGRTDLRHLADGRRHRRGDGRGRRAALRPDRQPRGLHGGTAVPARLAAAPKRAGAADQRQHPGGLQGRRRSDDRDDPTAEPAWRRRRRTQFLRTGVCCWPASSARSTCSCSRSA